MKQYPEELGVEKHLVHVGIGDCTERWHEGPLYLHMQSLTRHTALCGSSVVAPLLNDPV